MFARPFWTERIAALLARKNVLWLSGVRRAGKTVGGAGEGGVRVVKDAVGGEAQDVLEGDCARVSPEFAELLREYTIGVSRQP